jgi:hypothetical protein
MSEDDEAPDDGGNEDEPCHIRRSLEMMKTLLEVVWLVARLVRM